MSEWQPIRPRQHAKPRPQGTREDIWNGWTRNYIHREDGYITHAFSEKQCKQMREFRSLCGVHLSESGLLNLGSNHSENLVRYQEWIPGCKKCQRILRNMGLGHVLDKSLKTLRVES